MFEFYKNVNILKNVKMFQIKNNIDLNEIHFTIVLRFLVFLRNIRSKMAEKYLKNVNFGQYYSKTKSGSSYIIELVITERNNPLERKQVAHLNNSLTLKNPIYLKEYNSSQESIEEYTK